MCAWVITMAVTFKPWRARTSRMLDISSPGSTTMASQACSSPKMEQLHCSGPTGRISWIICILYWYARSFCELATLASHRVHDDIAWRHDLLAASAGAGQRGYG